MCKQAETITTEPKRIEKFHNALNKISWSNDNHLDNLKVIFDALNELASNDLEYYNKHREKSKKLSLWTRGLSITFATLGVIFMLLQYLDETNITNCLIASSICFALATAALMVNKLFCVSNSHIRYVATQFDLGSAIIKFSLDWQNWLIKNSDIPTDKIDIDKAFIIFKEFSEHSYKIISDETKIWENNLMDALSEYQKFVKNNIPKK